VARRLARSGLTRISRAGTCTDAGASVPGSSTYSLSGTPSATDSAADPDAPKRGGGDDEVGGVLGAQESSPPETEFGLGLSADGEGGALNWLLALLAALVALAIAAALAARRRPLPLAFIAYAEPVDRDARPILFLNVDGVIAVHPESEELPLGEWYELGSSRAYVPDQALERVRALTSRFELVWATRWEDRANECFGPRLGFRDDVKVVRLGSDERWDAGTRKIKAIDAAAGKRPAAWVDANITRRDEGWAKTRLAPTLLVRTDPYEGISDDDVGRLFKWADSLAAEKTGARFTRPRRPTRASSVR